MRHHLESFLETARAEDSWAEAVAPWVERDFRAYFRCGIVAHGFARARCGDCGDDAGSFLIRSSGELQERSSRTRRLRWAQLLARVFEVLPRLCPACGGSMRIVCSLTDPPVVRAILLHLDLPHRPPPLVPARG